MSRNRVIGNKGVLPWRLPADLKYFKNKTSGHPVIMGRKTFESLSGPLPLRENIVVSQNVAYKATGTTVFGSLDKAIKYTKDKYSGTKDELFIIGGEQIFKQALGIADKIYLTIIDQEFDGDAFFPPLPSCFVEASREDHLENELPYSFLVYKKQKAQS